jgi:hypothetical protein
MLTQKRLKEVLRYDSDSGLFFWTKDMGSRAKIGEQAGSPRKNGYLSIMVDKKSHYCHRLAWLYIYGEFPDGEVDHINHNKSDNRLCNLRAVLHCQNGKNTKLPTDNKSGVVGVILDKANNKWMAYINSEGKRKHLGRYSDYFEAICVRKSAESKYGFHPNHGL